jgi:nicotinic acid mononucleotide adenylyltransferase
MRAVSLEYARSLAYANLSNAAFENADSIDHHENFGIAITGAHYNDKPSHAWVYIATEKWDAYMHFSVGPSRNRESVGRIVSDRVQWFVNACMLSQETWTTHISEIDDSLEINNIDVLYAPGVSDIERLLLLKPLNPLVYHEGKFHRVVDYVRRYPTVYPGAFNPPTKKHLSVEDCLYEVSQQHYYKGGLSIEDVLHRVRMLDAAGRPTLITQASRFIDKHAVLTSHGADQVVFTVGADAWNITTVAHQYSSTNWLNEHLPDTSFIVMPRQGIDIVDNQIAKTLSWSVAPASIMDEFNSTAVRGSDDSGEHDFLSSEVGEYVKKHELYI